MDNGQTSFLGMLDSKKAKMLSEYEVKEAKRKQIMDQEWSKLGSTNALNIREYVRECELRFFDELGERYDERDDEHLDDNDIIGTCFSCGREITAGMMRIVDCISYSWTHKDGSPITARCCFGRPECQRGQFKPEEGRPIVSFCNPSHQESWLHHHYLRLCGLTEKEYREKLKIESSNVYASRVASGWYKGLDECRTGNR